MFGPFKKKPTPATRSAPRFPPVPKWRPHFSQPLEEIIDRVAYYTDHKKDFAVFNHGTCVILPQNKLAEEDGAKVAKDVLEKIYEFHPDMNPRTMDDGNIAVLYNHPAINVVLEAFAQTHWDEIERNHHDALATSEVLITPHGPNKFDDFGKKAFGADATCSWTHKTLK
jgi:hypothetical protein